jgi:precorrin-2 dehydrogenase/sirohydrochlorin ferrochelatase
MFPIVLDLRDRLCLVVGGGSVGQRKARALLQSQARVRLVCLEPRPPGWDKPHLDWRCQGFVPSHLDGITLAFAAATEEINRQVTAAAHKRGVWVNSATEPEQGDFHLPATLRRGDLTVAISTGGAAPMFARALREQLERMLDEEHGLWVRLVGELRQALQERGLGDEERNRRLEQACATEWLERLRSEGYEQTRLRMWAALLEAKGDGSDGAT